MEEEESTRINGARDECGSGGDERGSGRGGSGFFLASVEATELIDEYEGRYRI